MPQPGQKLGRFTLVEALGKGAAAVVFRATDALLGADVCIKVVHPSIVKDQEVLARLTREVLLSRRVASPHVCRVYDQHHEQGLHFISMDFIPGQPLDEVIQSAPDHSLDVDVALRIVADIADGVAAAHREGVIHRDLKPHNVMVRSDTGEAVILDFGVAFSAGLGNLTRPGVALGTLHWISPEVWRGETPTTQSDIYALGIILYNCLTGRAPLASKNIGGRLEALKAGLPLPSRRRADLPPAVDELFKNATAFEPGDRIRDADEFSRTARAIRSSLEFDLGELTEVLQTLPSVTASQPAPSAASGASAGSLPPEVASPARDDIGVYIGRAQKSEAPFGPAGGEDKDATTITALEELPTRVVAMPATISQPSSPPISNEQPPVVVVGSLDAFAQAPTRIVQAPMPDIEVGVDMEVEAQDEDEVDDVPLPDDGSFIIGGVAKERLKTRMFDRAAMAAATIAAPAAGPPSKPKALAARFPLVAAGIVGLAGALMTVVVYFGLTSPEAGAVLGGVVGLDGDSGMVGVVDVVDDVDGGLWEDELEELALIDPVDEPPPDDAVETEAADAGREQPEPAPQETEPVALTDAVVPSPEADPEPEAPPPPPTPVVERHGSTPSRASRHNADKGRYSRAISAYDGVVRKQGLLAADVPEAAREAARAHRSARKHAWRTAATQAEEARRLIDGVKVDRKFIEKKLARFNRAYDQSKDKALREQLKPVMGQVLKHMAGSRYGQANKALNAAFRQLK